MRKKERRTSAYQEAHLRYHLMITIYCGIKLLVMQWYGQTSIQNECRLKAYRPCPEEVGLAPVTLKPNKRPNIRGPTEGERGHCPQSHECYSRTFTRSVVASSTNRRTGLPGLYANPGEEDSWDKDYSKRDCPCCNRNNTEETSRALWTSQDTFHPYNSIWKGRPAQERD